MTHNAPPVVYPLGRSRFQACLLSGLWGSGVCCAWLWFHSGQPADWRLGVAGFAVLASGWSAFIGWKNTARGQLVWNGQSWFWESPGYQSGISEQQISVIADLQQFLLVRLENQSRKCMYLWCEQAALPERWMDFRRAVFSPGRHPGDMQAFSLSGHSDAAAMRVKQ